MVPVARICMTETDWPLLSNGRSFLRVYAALIAIRWPGCMLRICTASLSAIPVSQMPSLINRGSWSSLLYIAPANQQMEVSGCAVITLLVQNNTAPPINHSLGYPRFLHLRSKENGARIDLRCPHSVHCRCRWIVPAQRFSGPIACLDFACRVACLALYFSWVGVTERGPLTQV